MLYCFKKGKNATDICVICAEGAMTDQTCQKWFAKFLDNIDIFCQVVLYCGAVLCIGRCLAAPLASAC